MVSAITARLTVAAPLRWRAWTQDIAIAGFVTLFQLQGTDLLARPAGVDRLANHAHLGYLLLATSGLSLLVRRRWPVAVFTVVAAISVVYYTAGYPDGPAWLSVFVAFYSLTAYGDGRTSLVIAAAGKLVLLVVWLMTADLTPFSAAGWVFFRIGAVVMAASLGESVRARGVLAAEARQRAEEAERTREEEARRRVDAERLRIAREVHDSVAHAIAVINIHAGVTAHILDRRPEQAQEALVTIEQTSALVLRELRATLGMLRESDGELRAPTPGLGQLDDLLSTAADAGLEVSVDVEEAPRTLPSAVDHALFRILQESITNVIRHAGPARVDVRIACARDEVEVRVTDNGRGSRRDGTGGGSRGNGLLGMQERAALLGGWLTACPLGDGGFEVHARLPLVNGSGAG